MHKATTVGKLNPINSCTISIPGLERNSKPSENPNDPGGTVLLPGYKPETIVLNNLPDITDSKSAVYNQEAILGRSFPMYTYSHSGDRVINMQLHFFVVEYVDIATNLRYLRLLESAVYPRRSDVSGMPFQPPPVCQIECGRLLGNEPLCVVLQSCQARFDTNVPWDVETFVPFKMDVDTSWLTVYDSADLPFQDRIIKSGR